MSATLPPLPSAIQFLRDAARAPVIEWPRFVRHAPELNRVTIGEAGACAATLALQIKPITAQLTQIVPEGEASMRLVLTNLADALQMEFNARGQKPFYLEKD